MGITVGTNMKGEMKIWSYAEPLKGRMFTREELKSQYVFSRVNHYPIDQKDAYTKRVVQSFLNTGSRVCELPKVFEETVGTFYNSMEASVEEKSEQVRVIFAGKKYKPVADKVHPIYTDLPDEYRIHREITGNPLEGMPPLNPNPPAWKPEGRYTEERRDAMDAAHGDFLWPAEKAMLHDLIGEQDHAFAWDDTEKGHFRGDFYPGFEIPVVPHKV